jgi:hypothetical protein
MASRKDEKEQRRKERLAAEEAAKAAAARQQRMRLFGAVGLAILAVVAVVVAIGASGGKSGPKGPSAASLKGVNLPAVKDTNLTSAARTAGCVVLDYSKFFGPNGSSQSDPNNLYSHVGGKVNYKTNPPSFGNHNPSPASDGDYVGQGTPPKEQLVHALEHGRVEIQYRPGLPAAQVKQLETYFAKEQDGNFAPSQYLLLFQNETKMPYAVAEVAWAHILGCKTFTPKVFDAIRAFRIKYSFQGPEKQFVQPE